MTVAHIGPPLARQGGPSGYLLQLRRAAAECGVRDVLFPASAPARSAAPPSAWTRARRTLGRWKWQVVGRPDFYRPDDADLRMRGGLVARLVDDARRAAVEETAPSLDAAIAASADVWFCHDSATAAALLERRDRRPIWLFQHAPFSLAFYQAWCWAVPEWDWRDVNELPDVRELTSWETDVWSRVDRFLLPCEDALDEVARLDPHCAALKPSVEYILTGARAREAASHAGDRGAHRARWGFGAEPVGLFIGNNQPYRGLDALLAGLNQLSPSDAPGVVALAGPDPHMLPPHPRLRALGRVSDVAALLDAVDFVINVNRFSLFDLSTIEAVEAGRPLLLHDTGGNRTFRALGAGCVMIADLDPATVGDGLRGMFGLSAEERQALGDQSRRCYDHHLTLEHFWRRHAALYAHAGADRVAVS